MSFIGYNTVYEYSKYKPKAKTKTEMLKPFIKEHNKKNDDSIKGIMTRQASFDIRNYENGIARKKAGKNYVYYHIKSGNEVTKKDMDRITKLKIPPAWIHVWVSADPVASIQAIGQDDQGRKQYKYHELHIKQAEQEKFIRLYQFIKKLPKLDKAINDHKYQHNYDKNRVITTMLTIVKELYLRAGKETYAKENKSYGISSLRKKHIKIKDGKLGLRFKGKSGVRSSYTLSNPLVNAHIKELLKLGGEHLFQYVSDSDRIIPVNDTDLNDYIKAYMGPEFTVKDFRTYAANSLFVKALLQETQKRLPKNEKVIKKSIKNAINIVAHHLKHTKAISKKSYISNFIIELYTNNPDFFVERKLHDPDKVLLTVLDLYKREILKIR